MPITLTELFADEKPLQIPIGAHTLAVKYRVSGITPETEQVFRRLAQESAGQALVAFLLPILTDWDLLDDEGRPVPINQKTLSSLPVRFLSLITEAIGEDINPNPTSAGSSGAGSRRKAR